MSVKDNKVIILAAGPWRDIVSVKKTAEPTF